MGRRLINVYDNEVDNPKRLFSLDLLRTIAILLVVVCHLLRLYPAANNFIVNYLGTLGVEIFFVLSGFLIGTILIKKFNETDTFKFSNVREFWIRRWFRTLPNYYFVLIISIIVFSLFYYHEFMLNKLSNLAYFVFLQNSITIHPGFFPVAWSLAVEEWFYLLFPLWLLAISKLNMNKYKTLLVSILSFMLLDVILRIVVASISPGLSFDEVFRKMMPFRLDSIVIGVLVAFICFYHKSFWDNNKIKLFIIGGLLFLGSSIYFYYDFILNANNTMFTKMFLFNILGLSIALLFPLIYAIPKFKNTSITNLITHISLISYSIYLIHFFIIGGLERTSLGIITKIIISLILIFILSTLQYRFFEKPITAMRERFTKPKGLNT